MKQARSSLLAVSRVIAADALRDERSGLIALPDKSADHAMLDPPYGEYTHKKRWSGSGGKKRNGGFATPSSKPVTFKPWTRADIKLASTHLVRVVRGWVLVFCDSDLMPVWKEELARAGAQRKVTCIWTKPNGTPQFHGDGPAQPCEFIVTAWCGRGKSRWNGGGKQGHYSVPIEPSELRRHESQKPLRLMQQLVLDFTRPGELILDPTAGGGQTGVAAKMLGRRYLLWEHDAAMAAGAQAALGGAREQLAMFEATHRARPAAFGRQRQPAMQQPRLLEDAP